MTFLGLERHLPPDLLIKELRADARAGLTAAPKRIPSKWLFDAKGSKLWEQITQLPEYYPFSAERDILQSVSGEIAKITQASSVIELGSGFPEKIIILLRAFRDAGTIRGYTSIDISEVALTTAGERLTAEFPGLPVRAVLADFETQADIIASYDYPEPRLILFLGGSLSQLTPDQRAGFLRKLRSVFHPGDMLLIGVDLVKDIAQLMAAYDDSAGISTQFNKNLLAVLNAQVGATSTWTRSTTSSPGMIRPSGWRCGSSRGLTRSSACRGSACPWSWRPANGSGPLFRPSSARMASRKSWIAPGSSRTSGGPIRTAGTPCPCPS